MTENALIVVETLTPAIVFGDGGVDDVLGRLRKAATEAAKDLDISTDSGRKQIASVAYKVARSKTALDGLGKDLVADLKARAGKIDAERRRLWDGCETLQNEIRQPLTEWENAEKTRKEAHEAAIGAMEALAVFVEPQPASSAIRARMADLKKMAEDGRDWQEFRDRAKKSALATHGALAQLLEQAEAREKAAAEAEQRRQEEAARQQREREERIAREAAERAKREAEQAAQAERRRLEAERKAAEEAALAEQRRLEAEKKAAEDARRAAEEAKVRAEKEAAAAKERADREAAAAKERAEKAAREAEERVRREAEQKRQAEEAEAARREANKRHRAKINREAVAALVAGGLTEETAKTVVTLIATKAVPHVSITY